MLVPARWDKALKIAILGTHGIPAKYGGFETCAEELGVRLVERGHSVTVYSETSGLENGELASYKGVHLVQVPKLRGKAPNYVFHSFISAMMASFSDADVLHFFGCDQVPFTLLGRLARKRVILTVDGLEWERMGYPSSFRRYLRSFAELATVFPNVTVADSKISQDWYFQRTGVSPSYIPYGTNLSMGTDPQILRKYGLRANGYILFVGRLVYEKGAHTVIEAFKSVRTELKLVIVGDTLDADEYAKRLKENSNQRIAFLGFVHGNDFDTIRNGAYVYIHPSLFDGTSIALLGALGAGRPVISSDLKENQDVGGDAAVYFETGNPSDLTEKLQYLLDNPWQIEDRGRRSVDRAKELFDWDKITDSYEQVYRSSRSRG
jgi:glycosyltransferase involved in cell wall biosynthesis